MSFSLINVCIIISPTPVSISETIVREEGGVDNQHGYQLVLRTSSSASTTLRSITSDISRSAHHIFDRLTGTGIYLMPSMVTIPGVNSCIGALKNFSEESNGNYTFFAGPKYVVTSAAYNILDLEDAYCIVRKCYKWLMSLRAQRVTNAILVAQPITTKHNKTTMTERNSLELGVQ